MKARNRRLIFNFLAPPLFGVLIFIIWSLIANFDSLISNGNFVDSWRDIAAFVAAAYIFMGVQSIVFSLLMEFIVHPNASNCFQYVICSVVLGVLASCVTFDNRGMWVVGGVVGLLTGLISYNLTAENNQRK